MKTASILFINNKKAIFEQSDGGASNRSNLFMEALTQIGELDVVSFVSETESNIPGCKVIFSKNIPSTRNIIPRAKFKRLSKLLRLFTAKPSDLYPKTKEKIILLNELVQKKNYDFIACRYLDAVIECDLLKFSDKLIVDLDDNPVQVYLKDHGMGPSSSFRKKVYDRLFLLLMERRINRILKPVFCVFHSSPNENHPPNSIFLHNLSTIKEGVIPMRESVPLRVIMVGFWAYIVNENGIRHFVKNIWPKVLNMVSNAQFHVIGPYMSEELKELLEGCDGIVVRGFVDNLYKEYENCRVVAVPIYDGTGTSIKTVEAFMVGRPVVSTSMGMRGFSEKMKDGEDFILADSDDAFAEGLVSLLLNQNESGRIANNAFNKFRRNWSKEEFMKIVRESIELNSSK